MTHSRGYNRQFLKQMSQKRLLTNQFSVIVITLAIVSNYFPLGLQNKYLKELLKKMKDLDSEHPLNQTLPIPGYDETDKNSVSENFEVTRADFYERILGLISGLSEGKVAGISESFISAVKENKLSSLRNALKLAFNPHSITRTNFVERKNDLPEDPDHRILVNCREAFDWPYEDKQALRAFEEYLDIQWLEMCRLYDPMRSGTQFGTRLSRCCSIIQSSCTGKSRLMQQ